MKPIEDLVADILGTKPSLEGLIDRLREAVRQYEEREPLEVRQYADRYWVLVAYTNGLVRLRLFIEQNFNYIETMSLLAVTRYVFELILWLKLLEKDSRYGLVYYRRLIDTQLHYYTDLREHLTHEIAALKVFDAEEAILMKKGVENAQAISDPKARAEALRRVSSDAAAEIDRRAARVFGLYTEQAQTNGYGFQAHLVESKAVPAVSQSVAELEKSIQSFDRKVPAEIVALASKRWEWRKQATLVGFEREYDFIYSYTSKLIHATPGSMTTDQKNLELDEVRTFLRYIKVRFMDAVEMATRLMHPSI
jgi:hypothetical protein